MRLINPYKVPEARDILWDVLVERSTDDDEHVNISHRKLPSREDHEKLIDQHPWYKLFVLGYRDKYVGMVNITSFNEIGIFLLRRYQGQGLGELALRLVLARCTPLPAKPSVRVGYFLANINPENERSIHLFEKLGFRHISNTYSLEKHAQAER